MCPYTIIIIICPVACLTAWSVRPPCSCSYMLHTTNVLSVWFQTILVGDSGVGKTSLLVQFDQGKFSSGSFSATVGIGFTVSHSSFCNQRWCRPSRAITSLYGYGHLYPLVDIMYATGFEA